MASIIQSAVQTVAQTTITVSIFLSAVNFVTLLSRFGDNDTMTLGELARLRIPPSPHSLDACFCRLLFIS